MSVRFALTCGDLIGLQVPYSEQLFATQTADKELIILLLEK